MKVKENEMEEEDKSCSQNKPIAFYCGLETLITRETLNAQP